MQIGIAIGIGTGGHIASEPALSGASFAQLGTTYGNDGSPDQITWPAVRGAFLIDSHDKYAQYIQRYNGNTRKCAFVRSNDAGASWADDEPAAGGEGFLLRGSAVYDAGRDVIHRLVLTTNPGDGGIIYRQDAITRDGSGNITDITRTVSNATGMDNAASSYEFPTLIMPDANTLVAAWTASTGSGGEIRACKCDLSGSSTAGGTESNWVHLGLNSTTTIGGAPNVGSYTIIFTQGGAALTYFALKLLASGDLGWLYHSGPSPGQYRWRRSVKNAAVTWNSLSTPVAVSSVQRAGTDAGYGTGVGEGPKAQLIGQLTEDASGNVYGFLATWKDNTNGDTSSVVKVSSAEAVTLLDLYSAGGKHSYAPTGDAAYDSGSGRVVASYINTTNQYAYLALVNPATMATTFGPSLAFNSAPVDIPVIVSPRQGGKVLLSFRDTVNSPTPPYTAWFGTLTWS